MPFEAARTNLCELLTNLSFVKVVAIQKNGAAYTGEAVEVFGSKRLAFFDKFGRTRGFLTVGPMTLTQAPLGFDHSSSIPSVGEVLVGTLVQNARKSHLAMVLRGWSSDAKCLSELYRLIKFGTKKTELENRSLLLQPAGFLPAFQPYKHEVYVVARIVLWDNLRPLQVLASKQDATLVLKAPASVAELNVDTFISIPALQFAQLVSIKLEDPDILDKFMDGFLQVASSLPPPSIAPSYAPYTTYQPHSPIYVPKSPPGPTETLYNPTSPTYEPSSPKYAFDE